MITRLKGIGTQTDGPLIWASRGSFFWHQLLKLKPMFQWCTGWRVGDGSSVSFWYDNWNGLPLGSIRDGLPRPQHQASSLRDAFPLMSDLVLQIAISSTVQLNDCPDELYWRWTATGSYSSNSVYKMLSVGGLIKWRFTKAWNCQAPIKAKIFAFLVLKEKILTHDMMDRRGMTCEMRCVLCNSCAVETTFHLLFSCSYAREVWHWVPFFVGWQLMISGESIQQTWDLSWGASQLARAVRRKEWTSRFICVIWSIWKQRNEMVFRSQALPARLLAERIKEEGIYGFDFAQLM